MKQLELHWKSEMAVEWFSLISVAGRLSRPVVYIKHLGYDCVLGSRMDLSLDVSPSCDLSAKELGRGLPVHRILPPQLPRLLLLCFPFKVMQYSERTATNTSHQTVAPGLWWSPSVLPHKYSLPLAPLGPSLGFLGYFFSFYSLWWYLQVFCK